MAHKHVPNNYLDSKSTRDMMQGFVSRFTKERDPHLYALWNSPKATGKSENADSPEYLFRRMVQNLQNAATNQEKEELRGENVNHELRDKYIRTALQQLPEYADQLQKMVETYAQAHPDEVRDYRDGYRDLKRMADAAAEIKAFAQDLLNQPDVVTVAEADAGLEAAQKTFMLAEENLANAINFVDTLPPQAKANLKRGLGYCPNAKLNVLDKEILSGDALAETDLTDVGAECDGIISGLSHSIELQEEELATLREAEKSREAEKTKAQNDIEQKIRQTSAQLSKEISEQDARITALSDELEKLNSKSLAHFQAQRAKDNLALADLAEKIGPEDKDLNLGLTDSQAWKNMESAEDLKKVLKTAEEMEASLKKQVQNKIPDKWANNHSLTNLAKAADELKQKLKKEIPLLEQAKDELGTWSKPDYWREVPEELFSLDKNLLSRLRALQAPLMKLKAQIKIKKTPELVGKLSKDFSSLGCGEALKNLFTGDYKLPDGLRQDITAILDNQESVQNYFNRLNQKCDKLSGTEKKRQQGLIAVQKKAWNELITCLKSENDLLGKCEGNKASFEKLYEAEITPVLTKRFRDRQQEVSKKKEQLENCRNIIMAWNNNCYKQQYMAQVQKMIKDWLPFFEGEKRIPEIQAELSEANETIRKLRTAQSILSKAQEDQLKNLGSELDRVSMERSKKINSLDSSIRCLTDTRNMVVETLKPSLLNLRNCKEELQEASQKVKEATKISQGAADEEKAAIRRQTLAVIKQMEEKSGRLIQQLTDATKTFWSDHKHFTLMKNALIDYQRALARLGDDQRNLVSVQKAAKDAQEKVNDYLTAKGDRDRVPYTSWGRKRQDAAVELSALFDTTFATLENLEKRSGEVPQATITELVPKTELGKKLLKPAVSESKFLPQLAK